MKQCRPHEWNITDWLPLIKGSQPEKHDSIRCLECGRVLHVKDTYPAMRANIAHGIANRYGDEYSEVHASVMDFFSKALTRFRQGDKPESLSADGIPKVYQPPERTYRKRKPIL